MEIPFAKAEAVGRSCLENGELEELRGWCTLSYSRLAQHLLTNSKTLKRWLAEPEFARNIHATTAARIGEFMISTSVLVQLMLNEGVRVIDLYPLNLLAGQMGRSVNSPHFQELCRAKEITCYDMGPLGVYVPRVQAEELKGRK